MGCKINLKKIIEILTPPPKKKERKKSMSVTVPVISCLPEFLLFYSESHQRVNNHVRVSHMCLFFCRVKSFLTREHWDPITECRPPLQCKKKLNFKPVIARESKSELSRGEG